MKTKKNDYIFQKNTQEKTNSSKVTKQSQQARRVRDERKKDKNVKRINKIRHTKIRNITKATDGLAQALALKWK